MVFDYEKAWAELQHRIATDERPNWGARQLRDEMGLILDRCRVNENGLPMTLRLYGVEVEARLQAHMAPGAPADGRAQSTDETDPTPPASAPAGATASSARPHRSTRGGHDARGQRAPAGRGR